MYACSLLLGCPWEFDINGIQYDKANKCTLMHKGRKNALVTMIPVEIVKYEHDKKMCNIKNARILQSESNK